MAKLCDMLACLRKREGLSQSELAAKLGMTRSAIGMYETGKREPDLETLAALADFYQVDMNTLTGRHDYPVNDAAKHIAYGQEFNALTEEQKIRALASVQAAPSNLKPLEPMEKIPLIGRIACGTPILAEENIAEYVELPRSIHADFALLCQGDSMAGTGIEDGDIVYIRSQPMVESGEIAAVMVEDDEATLKRFKRVGDTVLLIPENSKYEPFIFTGKQIETIRIIGKAVGFTRLF